MADAEDVPMDSQYMDYAEHERSYAMFIAMTKWGAIGIAILLVLMAFFLV